MAVVEIRDLRKSYGAFEVIKGVSVHVADGEFVVLVGPSGCGKSTLLRTIAGLEDISSGEISIGGKVVNELEPRERDIAMVFQTYALYPHMTVRDNMAFNLTLRKASDAEIAQKVSEAAEILGLNELLDRKPRELSGGQRQRVAMGRAIVRKPQVFLFDEPLSNLDAQLRVQMRAEVRALHDRLSATSIYVTHDQVEAMTMADRIVVLDKGRIAQSGSPLELYDRPANRFVAEFIGSPAINMFSADVDGGRLSIPSGEARVELPLPGAVAEKQVDVGIRPEHFYRVDSNGIEGTVRVIEHLGAETYVFVDAAKRSLCWRIPGRPEVAVGEKLRLGFEPKHVHLFSSSTGMRV
jgi:multiple sugar transport system ATP-binding protein